MTDFSWFLRTQKSLMIVFFLIIAISALILYLFYLLVVAGKLRDNNQQLMQFSKYLSESINSAYTITALNTIIIHWVIKISANKIEIRSVDAVSLLWFIFLIWPKYTYQWFSDFPLVDLYQTDDINLIIITLTCQFHPVTAFLLIFGSWKSSFVNCDFTNATEYVVAYKIEKFCNLFLDLR